MDKILVIGSTNMDISAQVEHLPAPGETVGGAKLFTAFGGKGANQAVAAARAGGKVSFVGSIGNDANGEQMAKNFRKEGINTDHLTVTKETASGTALIFVDDKGENCIVVAPGANHSVSPAMIDEAEELIKEAGLILLQLEIPYETVQYICKVARKHDRKVLLNPAPAHSLDNEILESLEYLILNETEIEMISGESLTDENMKSICESLSKTGPENIILTLGSKGCYIFNDEIQQFVKGFKVDAVDSTAAGDTFCGVFATALARFDGDLRQAVKFANAAGALSVTKAGAQTSIPTLVEIESFLDHPED